MAGTVPGAGCQQQHRVPRLHIRLSGKSGWRGKLLSDATKKTSPYTARRKWCFLLKSISIISRVHCTYRLNWAKCTQTQCTWVERDRLPWASRELVFPWTKPQWVLSWKLIVSQHRMRTDNFEIKPIPMQEASCCSWLRPGALWAQGHRDDQSWLPVP